jgi:hypothetical protein
VDVSDADGTGLTPPGTFSKQIVGGNPNLNAEVAYEWTYGAVWTPAKLIKGLTLSMDFYHIDLRNTVVGLNLGSLVDLPHDLSGRIQRDPVTGAIVSVDTSLHNGARGITEGLDYEVFYQLDTSIFGHGNLGTLNLTFDGNYLARFVRQEGPAEPRINIDGDFIGVRFGSYPQNRWYASLFYDLGGLDAGAIVHYIGQYSDGDRKIREWTTLDLILNYTFNLPASTAQNEVPGFARNGRKNAKTSGDKDKNAIPVSTAEYNPCGWRGWLNNTTVTFGINNVFDLSPPFVDGAFQDGYDPRQANIRGRVWYVALTKRF